jgi:hypothetical protein
MPRQPWLASQLNFWKELKMSDISNRHRQRPSRRSDPRTLSRFIEELSWLLSSYEDLDFRALKDIGYLRIRHQSAQTLERINPKNPNISFLVGALPGLFNDETLFPTNEDIAEFAQVALKVRIPRWEKKSKFELIGHIVCNTAQLSDKKLEMLVRALSRFLEEGREARAIVASRRDSGLSWNEVIQRLLSRSS